MHFRHTSLTFSGLRQMCHKKEYGLMYTGLKRVHLQHRLAARTKMMDGMAKIEDDEK
jgi:hypothetical protein